MIKKIKILKFYKINVVLQATIHRSLIDQLEALGDFAKKNKILIGFNRLVPVGKAKELNGEFLTPPEFKEALTKITKLKQHNKFIYCSDPLLFLVDKERKDYFRKKALRDGNRNIIGGCIAGIAALYISAKGEIFPCAFLRNSIGNVFNEDLESVWLNNKVLKKLRNRLNFSGKCKNCPYLSYCGGCRAWAFSVNGNLFSSDPLCWL